MFEALLISLGIILVMHDKGTPKRGSPLGTEDYQLDAFVCLVSYLVISSS